MRYTSFTHIDQIWNKTRLIVQSRMQCEVGRSNGGLSIVASGRYHGVTYVVYGSAENVLVLNADCELLQVLRHPNHAKLRGLTVCCVDFCSATGRLAAAYGSQVLVFSNNQNKGSKVNWEFEFSLEHQAPVRTVSWRPTGDVLLTGGDVLTLWQGEKFENTQTVKSWAKLWETRSASPITLARFSPDGRFFATMIEYDRLVKVWFQAEVEFALPSKAMVFQFVYLDHPRSVLNFSWRKPLVSPDNAINFKNILLTTCRDGVCRIWSETSIEEPVRFFMCAFIDPSQAMITAESEVPVGGPFGWIDNEELYCAMAAAVDPSGLSDREQPSITMSGRRLSAHLPYASRSNPYLNSLVSSRRRPPPGTEFFRRVRSRLPGILSDSPDLLFQVQQDGSLVIWGIQHLSEEPRRIPKVVLVLRTPNALPKHVAAAICPDFFVFAERSSAVPGAYLIPPELALLCQGSSGRILTLGINLKDTFSARDSGKLSLHADLAGHKSSVQVIGTHPNLPFVVTCASHPHELVVWLIKSREAFHSRSLVQIDALATVESSSGKPFTHVVWVPQLDEDVSTKPKVLFFVAADRTGTLFLYRFQTKPIPEVTLISQTFDNAYRGGFLSLHIYFERFTTPSSDLNTSTNLDTSNSEETTQESTPGIFLLGLSPSSDLTFWQLKQSDQSQMNIFRVWAGHLFDSTESDVGALKFSEQLDLITVSMTNGTLSPAFLFCTVHEDAVLRMWRCTNSSVGEAVLDSNTTKLCEVAISVQLPRIPSSVSAASYGFIAVAYSDAEPQTVDGKINKYSRATVNVYEYLRYCLHLRLIYEWSATEQIDENEEANVLAGTDRSWALPVPLSWTCLPDGSLALAMGLGNRIFVHGRHRARSDKFRPPVWDCLASVVYPERTPLLRVAFTGPEGHLISVNTSDPTLSLVSPWAWTWSDFIGAEDQTGKASETPPSLAMMFAAALPLLPDYHPDILIQYALSGEFNRMRAILRHLRDSLVLSSTPILPSRPTSRASSHPGSRSSSFSMPTTKKRALTIPPIPLNALLIKNAATMTTAPSTSINENKAPAANPNRYDELFSSIDESSTQEDEESHDESPQTSRKLGDDHVHWQHNDEDMLPYLAESLTRIALPGITQTEQICLLAVIDTLAQMEQQKRALDDNGGRYALSLRLFTYLRRSLPPTQRPSTLSHRDIAWALHSQSQDILLDLCSTMSGNQSQITWKTQKSVGLGWWLTNPDALRRHVELMAKNQYMSKEQHDPVDCSLFYLALGKKKVLAGLWKQAQTNPDHTKMYTFLSNDFEQPRWQQAALKNAYALLGRQRFEYAAAFFLLGGCLKDAVNVLHKNLGDTQLAIVVARLGEGDKGPILNQLLRKTILPAAVSNQDRWLSSNVLWMLGEKERAAAVIVGDLRAYLEQDEIQELDHLLNVKSGEQSSLGSSTSSQAGTPILTPSASSVVLSTPSQGFNPVSSSSNTSLTSVNTNHGGVVDSALLIHYRYLRSQPQTISSSKSATSTWPAVSTAQVASFATSVAASYEDLGAAVMALEALSFGGKLCIEIAQEHQQQQQQQLSSRSNPGSSFSLLGSSATAANLAAIPPSSSGGDRAEFLFGGPDLSSPDPFALDAEFSFSLSLQSGTLSDSWDKPRLPPSLAFLAKEEVVSTPPTRSSLVDKGAIDEAAAQVRNDPVLEHYLRVLSVQRCAVALRLSLSVTTALDVGNRIWFIEHQRQCKLLPNYGKEAYEGLNILCGLAAEPPLHPSLVQRWLKRACHMTEQPIAHCALLSGSSFKPEQADLEGPNEILTDSPVSPAIAASVTDLLYRKCTFIASLAFLLEREWDDILEKHKMTNVKELPQIPRPLALKLDFINYLAIALLEALYIQRHSVFQHLLTPGYREGPGQLLEMVWCITLASMTAALLQGKFLRVAHWLRGLRAVFFNKPLNGYYEPFKTLLTIATTGLEELLATEEELLKNDQNGRGHDHDDNDDDDDEALTMKKAKHSKSGSNGASLIGMSHLMALATYRYLFCRLEATLEDLESQIEVNNSVISDGIMTSLALLIGLKESHVTELLPHQSVAQHWPTPIHERLWSTLQELYYNAGIVDGYVNTSLPVQNSLSLSPSSGPAYNDRLVDPRIEQSASASSQQRPSPTSFPRVVSAPQLSGSEISLYTPYIDGSYGEIVCRANDIIEALCINQAEVNYISVSVGKRVHEVELDNYFGQVLGQKHPGRESSGDQDDMTAEALRIAAAEASANGALSPRSRRSVVSDKTPATLTFSDETLLRSAFDGSTASTNPAVSYGHKRHQSVGGRGQDAMVSSMTDAMRRMNSQDFDGENFSRKITVNTMVSHPTMPFYLTGSHDGVVSLWQYRQPPPPLIQYRLAESPKITSLRFSMFGVKFGATDLRGYLNLWNFEARQEGQQAYQTLQVHSKAAHDFVFLTSASFIASAGWSETQKNVALWDTLLPPGKNRVKGFLVHDSGCHSLGFSQRNNLLLSGGKKGDLTMFELRTMQAFKTKSNAHSRNIKAIAIDDVNNYFYTGSTDGDIRVWSFETLEPVHVMHNIHQKNTFLRASFDRSVVSTYGVMDLLVDDQFLYSCGADGTVKRHPLFTSKNFT